MADKEVGYYSPETARNVLSDIAGLKAREGRHGRGGRQTPYPLTIPLNNETNVEIPRWALLAVIGADIINNQMFLRIRQPVEGDSYFVWNGSTIIPAGGYGRAQTGRMIRFLSDDSPVFGKSMSMIDQSWKMSDTGGIPGLIYLGSDGLQSDLHQGLIVTNLGTSGMYKTPSGGIGGRSGDTVQSAECTPVDIVNGVLTELTGTGTAALTLQTVFNPSADPIAGDAYIHASESRTGILIATWEDC